MKNTITKCLLSLDEKGKVIIELKEVNRHIPVNRMLNEVGFYGLDSIQVEGLTYMIVVRYEEFETKKSVILVSRIEKDMEGERIIDLNDDDMKHMIVIANHYLNVQKDVIS